MNISTNTKLVNLMETIFAFPFLLLGVLIFCCTTQKRSRKMLMKQKMGIYRESKAQTQVKASVPTTIYVFFFLFIKNINQYWGTGQSCLNKTLLIKFMVKKVETGVLSFVHNVWKKACGSMEWKIRFVCRHACNEESLFLVAAFNSRV